MDPVTVNAYYLSSANQYGEFHIVFASSQSDGRSSYMRDTQPIKSAHFADPIAYGRLFSRSNFRSRNNYFIWFQFELGMLMHASQREKFFIK